MVVLQKMNNWFQGAWNALYILNIVFICHFCVYVDKKLNFSLDFQISCQKLHFFPTRISFLETYLAANLPAISKSKDIISRYEFYNLDYIFHRIAIKSDYITYQ